MNRGKLQNKKTREYAAAIAKRRNANLTALLAVEICLRTYSIKEKSRNQNDIDVLENRFVLYKKHARVRIEVELKSQLKNPERYKIRELELLAQCISVYDTGMVSLVRKALNAADIGHSTRHGSEYIERFGQNGFFMKTKRPKFVGQFNEYIINEPI